CCFFRKPLIFGKTGGALRISRTTSLRSVVLAFPLFFSFIVDFGVVDFGATETPFLTGFAATEAVFCLSVFSLFLDPSLPLTGFELIEGFASLESFLTLEGFERGALLDVFFAVLIGFLAGILNLV